MQILYDDEHMDVTGAVPVNNCAAQVPSARSSTN
jgi:hypothetical protein